MNVTYRIVDPKDMSIRDQGMFDDRSGNDRMHFNRVSRKAHNRGLVVITMATGHQQPMFEAEPGKFVEQIITKEAA